MRFEILTVSGLLLLLSLSANAAGQGWSETESLDALLPTPLWIRSRADELNIDQATQQQIQKTYLAMEPKYHELKRTVEAKTAKLNATLTVDELDEDLTLNRMRDLLEAESALKLYQVQVRLKLLSSLSVDQWRQAQDLVKRKPKSNWQKVMRDKIERVRQLSQTVQNANGSIADIEGKLQAIAETTAAGKVTESARALDRIIVDLESRLEKLEK